MDRIKPSKFKMECNGYYRYECVYSDNVVNMASKSLQFYVICAKKK